MTAKELTFAIVNILLLGVVLSLIVYTGFVHPRNVSRPATAPPTFWITLIEDLSEYMPGKNMPSGCNMVYWSEYYFTCTKTTAYGYVTISASKEFTILHTSVVLNKGYGLVIGDVAAYLGKPDIIKMGKRSAMARFNNITLFVYGAPKYRITLNDVSNILSIGALV